MNTMAYILDPSGNKMINVIDKYALYSLREGVDTANLTMNTHLDKYDQSNLNDAIDFLLNSVDDELEKRLLQSSFDGYSFAPYWFRLVHLVYIQIRLGQIPMDSNEFVAATQAAKLQAEDQPAAISPPRPTGPCPLCTPQSSAAVVTTRSQDHVYLPSMNRSTDQVRHAEYEATAMDAHAVVIHGHRFHHSTVMTALDTHAQVSHAATVNAIAAHDGHVNAGNSQYNDI